VKVEWLDVKELKATPPPPVPWVIEGFAAKGALTMLVGEPGQGKSYLTLALAAGVCAGEDAAGFTVPNGIRDVAVFDAENGPGEVHRRLDSLDYPPGLRVGITEAGFDLERQLYEIEEAGSELGTDLIVLDSLRTLWPGGDENDSDEVTRLLSGIQRVARTTDTAIVILHHRSKSGTYRGSGAMAAVPEILVHLGSHPRDKDASRRSLWWEKCRVGRRPSKRWVRLADGVEEAFRPGSDELWPSNE
jgi:RecA-family ATPase